MRLLAYIGEKLWQFSMLIAFLIAFVIIIGVFICIMYSLFRAVFDSRVILPLKIYCGISLLGLLGLLLSEGIKLV